MKILTIIPARCGSKGIKEKNIINLCGKPLISYSINIALELKHNNLVDTVLVSTDCEKIAKIARECGADVPFLRPGNISNDKAKSIEIYLHALDFYKNKNIEFDAVLLLQPTSPLRTYYLIKSAIDLFRREDKDSLISVYKEEYINELVMYESTSLVSLKPINLNHNKGVRRQQHKGIMVRNGSIYLTKVSYILKNKLLISDNPLFVEMKKSDSINIDTLEDLRLIRSVLCK